MAAGTLPYQKTGKDFLSSSHFTIGMDTSFIGVGTATQNLDQVS